MSTSTNAILFYGLCYWEEYKLPWEKPDDDYVVYMALRKEVSSTRFEDFLCKRLGGPAYPAYSPNRPHGVIETYWKERDAFLLASLGEEVSLVMHCSPESVMYGLAIERTRTVARRGGPESIANLDVPPAAREALRTTCAALGMDFEAEEQAGRLGWWLVSYCG